MKILVDAQMPPALAHWLREQGHDAQAVRDVGLREAEDGTIWAYARKNGSVIFTKDDDFAARAQREQDGPVIVWLRVGNNSNAALRAWLEPRLPGIIRLIEQGNGLIEVV